MWDNEWTRRAQCLQGNPETLFVRGAAQNRNKAVCAQCPVVTECLAEALDNQIRWGVWGGMTERQRRALLKKAGTMHSSWRAVLEKARDEAEAKAKDKTAAKAS